MSNVKISVVEIVLYVSDQARSREFYRAVLQQEPQLDVPGMTEIKIGGAVLGLMPLSGIQRLLGASADIVTSGARSEIYLVVDDPAAYGERALKAGATEVSPLSPRSWGQDVAYYADLDGHLIAFAKDSV